MHRSLLALALVITFACDRGEQPKPASERAERTASDPAPGEPAASDPAPTALADQASALPGREPAPQRPIDEQVAANSERFTGELYSLRYPAGWTAMATAEQGVGIMPSRGSPSDSFMENLNVVLVDNLDGSTDIDAMVERDMPAIEASIPEFRLISQTKVTLGGRPAVRIEYDAAIGELQLRTFQYMVSLGPKTCTITAIGARETVDAWRWQLESIAQSVEFSDRAG